MSTHDIHHVQDYHAPIDHPTKKLTRLTCLTLLIVSGPIGFERLNPNISLEINCSMLSFTEALIQNIGLSTTYGDTFLVIYTVKMCYSHINILISKRQRNSGIIFGI